MALHHQVTADIHPLDSVVATEVGDDTFLSCDEVVAHDAYYSVATRPPDDGIARDRRAVRSHDGGGSDVKLAGGGQIVAVEIPRRSVPLIEPNDPVAGDDKVARIGIRQHSNGKCFVGNQVVYVNVPRRGT